MKEKWKKRLTSILLIFSMLVPFFPFGVVEMVYAAAYGFNLSTLTVNAEYDGYTLKKMTLRVVVKRASGDLTSDASYAVVVDTVDGLGLPIGNVTIKKDATIGDTLSDKNFEITDPEKLAKLAAMETIKIGSRTVVVNYGSGYNFKNGDSIVKNNGDLNLQGSNLSGLTTDEIIIPDAKFASITSSDQTATIGKVEANSDGLGSKTIILRKTAQIDNAGEADASLKGDGKLYISKTYKDAFSLIEDYGYPELKMTPNMGEAGQTIYVTTKDPQKFTTASDYSIFFLKSNTEVISQDNRVDNASLEVSSDGKILKFKVPNFEIGPYSKVLLTNRITQNEKNLTKYIKKTQDLGQFMIASVGSGPKIKKVDPNSGPNNGDFVKLVGQNLDELSYVNGLGKVILKPENKAGDPKVVDEPIDMNLFENTGGSGSITNVSKVELNYQGIKDDTGADVKVRRTISTLIGADTIVDPSKGFTFSSLDGVTGGNTDDIFTIKTKANNADNKTVDVLLIVKTEVTKNGVTEKYIHIATLSKGYTFVKSEVTGEITSVTPDKIQAVEDSSGYVTKEDNVISIKGKDFKVYSYGENQDQSINYPAVDLGAGLIIKKVKDSSGAYRIKKLENIKDSDSSVELVDAEFEVYNDKGDVVNGGVNNNTGTKIVIHIPSNTKLDTNKISWDKANDVSIANPIYKDSGQGLPFSKVEALLYVRDAKNVPIIESVAPNVMTLDDGKEVVVKGQNFDAESKLYIDGLEMKGVKRSLDTDGKTVILKFNAPKSPDVHEGETRITIVNPDGGSDSSKFIFVKSISDAPKIKSFAPKKGTQGTVVVVDGDNFVQSQTSVTDTKGINIYRLLGSRILLKSADGDGSEIDVNIYNTDGSNSATPRLENYSSSNKLVNKKTDTILELADYYRAIILEESTGASVNYYSIYYDANDNIILYDGGTKALPGDKKNEFTMYLDDKGRIIAQRSDNLKFEVSVNEDSLVLTNLATGSISAASETITLKMKTAYKVEGGKIVGQRAYVQDKSRIIFTMPPKDRGKYNIIVVNPDTKKDVSKDTFEYFTTAILPAIENVVPSTGAATGGYSVTIEGKNFEDNSIVYVDGIEVDAKNVVREGNKLIITVMPAYKGNLQKEGIDRKTVPISIENEGGGSVTRERAFTYIIPGAHPPIIEKLTLQKDPQVAVASGGEILTIEGKYFLFEEPWDTSQKYKTWKKYTKDDGSIIWYDDLNSNDKWDTFSDSNKLPKVGEVDPINQKPYKLKLEKNIDVYENYIDNDSNNPNSRIFPQIFIGGQKAKIVEYKMIGTGGYLKVITPANTPGKASVYVMNNDFGVSNIKDITYAGSAPKITSINPAKGPITGNQKTYVYGQDFESQKILMGKADGSEFEESAQAMPIIRFGERIGSKDINNNLAELTVEDKKEKMIVKFEMNPETEKANVEFKIVQERDSGQVIYTKTYNNYDPKKEAFIDVSQFRTAQQDVYTGFELVKIKVADRKFTVERGYSPKGSVTNAKEMVIYTPSYSQVEKDVPVAYFNKDGGKADAKYEYTNPQSKPYISDLIKDQKEGPGRYTDQNGKTVRVLKLNYKGGYNIEIIGGDLLKEGNITIGDSIKIDAKDINFSSSPSKISFKMPEQKKDVVGKRFNLVVTNPDGASALSDGDEVNPPIYIEFTEGEPIPGIKNIDPNKGLSSGGTQVTITADFKEGSGTFRQGLKVWFGDVEATVQSVTYNQIKVVTPPHIPGTVDVVVQNPDGERVVYPKGFTYLSDPMITTVLDPNDANERTKIEVISVEGGQKIKVKGNGFVDGAKVIFVPVIKEDPKSESKNPIFRKGISYSLESGTEAKAVEFKDNETLIVTTPAGLLNTKGIIVINPDKGASNIYEGLTYGLPQIDAPGGVIAELVYDRMIKVHWNAVDKATQYEVYVVIDDNTRESIGSTKLTSLVYDDLEPNTRYKFVVKAIGEYGDSKASMESNSVKTGSVVGPEDTDGGLNENTQTKAEGNTAIITIGEKDYDKIPVIDLTNGALASTDKAIVTIPARVISQSDTRDIQIKGKDFALRFNPNVFYSSQVDANRNNDKAGVRINLGYSSNEYPVFNAGQTPLSRQFEVNGNFFLEQNQNAIENIAGNIELSLDFDYQKADLRRIKTASLMFKDPYQNQWNMVSSADASFSTSVTGNMNRLGVYTIMGRR